MLNPMIATHLIAAATKVIHTHACTLGSVILNTGAASATLTIYNNTAGSGDVIAIIDCSNTANGVQRDYNIFCPQGLTVVMAAGNADVTITSEGTQI